MNSDIEQQTDQENNSSSTKCCEFCNKEVSSANYARHVKVCPKKKEKDIQEEKNALTAKIGELENQVEELKKSQTVINNHYGDNNTSNQTNNIQNNVENKTQNNKLKNVYKCHRKDKDGELDGLNMDKVHSFGYENWDYIDKSKEPLEILMDLYANPDHPENYIFVYNEPQKFCLLVKFPQEVRSFPLNPGALYKLGGCIIDNLKNHGVSLPEDESKNRLIWTMFIQRFSQKYNYHNMYTNWNARDLDDYYIKMM